MQDPLADPGFTLLTAVCETPGEAYASGVVVTKDRAYQGSKRFHLGRHHQDVAGFKAVVVGQ